LRLLRDVFITQIELGQVDLTINVANKAIKPKLSINKYSSKEFNFGNIEL